MMNSLEELIVKYEGSKIPYSELIKTKHWLDKRKTIIQRDESICQSCKVKGIDLWDENILVNDYYKGKYAIVTKSSKTVDVVGGGKVFLGENFNPNKSLHVHHKLYYLDSSSGRFIFPWNYDDEHLETLCVRCHDNIHKKETIPVYFFDSKEKKILTPCHRCNSKGYLYQFKHVSNGICFRCNGEKFDEFIQKDNAIKKSNNYKDLEKEVKTNELINHEYKFYVTYSTFRTRENDIINDRKKSPVNFTNLYNKFPPIDKEQVRDVFQTWLRNFCNICIVMNMKGKKFIYDENIKYIKFDIKEIDNLNNNSDFPFDFEIKLTSNIKYDELEIAEKKWEPQEINIDTNFPF